MALSLQLPSNHAHKQLPASGIATDRQDQAIDSPRSLSSIIKNPPKGKEFNTSTSKDQPISSERTPPIDSKQNHRLGWSSSSPAFMSSRSLESNKSKAKSSHRRKKKIYERDDSPQASVKSSHSEQVVDPPSNPYQDSMRHFQQLVEEKRAVFAPPSLALPKFLATPSSPSKADDVKPLLATMRKNSMKLTVVMTATAATEDDIANTNETPQQQAEFSETAMMRYRDSRRQRSAVSWKEASSKFLEEISTSIRASSSLREELSSPPSSPRSTYISPSFLDPRTAESAMRSNTAKRYADLISKPLHSRRVPSIFSSDDQQQAMTTKPAASARSSDPPTNLLSSNLKHTKAEQPPLSPSNDGDSNSSDDDEGEEEDAVPIDESSEVFHSAKLSKSPMVAADVQEAIAGWGESYDFIRRERKSMNQQSEDEDDDSSSEQDQQALLDDRLYFGDAAKKKFFGKYRSMTSLAHKIITKDSTKPLILPLNQLQQSITAPTQASAQESLAKLSPRSRFLTRFLQISQSAPLPIIIRSDDNHEELNLSHMNLRDEYISLLSEVIHELPELAKINICDNHLSDHVVAQVIDAIATLPSIFDLNLSGNNIAKITSTSLLSFLSKDSCPLKVLKLSGVHLDDLQVSVFMRGIEANRSVEELDLSRNVIGSSSSSVAAVTMITSSSSTGTASIARAILANHSIRQLDLSWNQIGYLAARQLAVALDHSSCLQILSLAQNNIKDAGAEAISGTLYTNTSLRKLDLSYNCITGDGCFMLAYALRHNGYLEVIDLSGNSVGILGGYALISTLNFHDCPREIILHSCTYPEHLHHVLDGNKSSAHAFERLIYPTGDYRLDLSITRDRIIANELLYLASIRRGCLIVAMKEITKDHHVRSIRLKRSGNPAKDMGMAYGPWMGDPQHPRLRHPYTQLQASQWMERIRSLRLIDESTGQVYELPSDGILELSYRYVPRSATPIECLNATGIKRLIHLIVSHKKTLAAILRLCALLVMESYQLDEIMEAMLAAHAIERHQFLEIFTRLVSCCRDTSNNHALMRKYFHSSAQIREIQLHMRSFFYFSCCNAITGHYKLDLSIDQDRIFALRMMEINAQERAFIRTHRSDWRVSIATTGGKKKAGFTSQRGYGNNFRNEVFKGVAMSHLGTGFDDVFCAYGLLDKAPGILEFDYVSTTRPSRTVLPMDDASLDSLLLLGGVRGYAPGLAAALQHHHESWMSSQHGLPVEDDPASWRKMLHRRASIQKEVKVFSRGSVSISRRSSAPSAQPSASLASLVLAIMEANHQQHSTKKKQDDEHEHELRHHWLEELSSSDIQLMQDELAKDEAVYHISSDGILNRFAMRVKIMIDSPPAQPPRRAAFISAASAGISSPSAASATATSDLTSPRGARAASVLLSPTNRFVEAISPKNMSSATRLSLRLDTNASASKLMTSLSSSQITPHSGRRNTAVSPTATAALLSPASAASAENDRRGSISKTRRKLSSLRLSSSATDQVIQSSSLELLCAAYKHEPTVRIQEDKPHDSRIEYRHTGVNAHPHFRSTLPLEVLYPQIVESYDPATAIPSRSLPSSPQANPNKRDSMPAKSAALPSSHHRPTHKRFYLRDDM
jgi:Ran GTPase-activating protein (RanGAP) involved in mRNA processing and transport